MKIKIVLSFIFLTLTLMSCKKENDAGIQIDGNGRPASALNNGGVAKDSVLNGYGIAIDPNGSPAP